MEQDNGANHIKIMAFIIKTDLYRYLEQSTIDQLTDSTDSIVTEAIADAEDRIREKISPRYNLTTEAEKWLDDVFKGRLNVTLTTNDEAKEQGWPLRWGSQTKKGNQSF